VSFLVDANVLSEATKPDPDRRIIDWLKRHQAELVVDPIILGELRFGIVCLPKSARRKRLERWFDEGASRIQCLAWDGPTGLRWAQLLADLRARGRAMPIKDSLIAATALAHDLPLATLNRRDFEAARVELIDPRV
jgi:predicted nucleic acid-binding protein